MNALHVHENVFGNVLLMRALLESRETDSTGCAHLPGGSILGLAYSSHLHVSSGVAWPPCAGPNALPHAGHGPVSSPGWTRSCRVLPWARIAAFPSAVSHPAAAAAVRRLGDVCGCGSGDSSVPWR